MTPQSAPTAVGTFHRLLDLVRGQGMATDALPSALAWLVLGRLAEQGRAPALSTGLDRDPQRVVYAIRELDAPPVLQEALEKALSDWHAPLSSDAAYIVRQLLDGPQKSQWGLQDAAWLAVGKSRYGLDGHPAFDPALCDLAVASLHCGPGDHVWVPFDPSGQFTARLVGEGAHVWRAGPGYDAAALTVLLLALGDDPSDFDRVTFAATPPAVSGSSAVTKCLVAAPMAMKIPGAHPWRQWQGGARTGRVLWLDPDELDRSEAWAVAAMWPLVRDRGVFLASPSLMFAHGQEQRLRKALTQDRGGNMVVAVVSLPSGLMAGASVAPAMLVLDTRDRGQRVRMVDVGGVDGPGGIKSRLGKDVGVAAAAMLLQSGDQVPQIAGDIDLGEIEKCDFSLMPQRYLRRVEGLAGVRCALGDLVVQTVRSPVPTKDPNGWAVWEIGITGLDRWRPITSGYERSMEITPRKADEALLREGDLVLSIKGTVGRAGIVGAIPATYDEAKIAEVTAVLSDASPTAPGKPRSVAAVAAASCVALRVDRQKVLPEYLLLYLRSDDFKQQLEALRVGAAIAHITPAALLAGVQVLLMPLEAQRRLSERYRELCGLEEKVEQLQRRMLEIRDRPFTTAAAE